MIGLFICYHVDGGVVYLSLSNRPIQSDRKQTKDLDVISGFYYQSFACLVPARHQESDNNKMSCYYMFIHSLGTFSLRKI
jgi:hypothetical protein